MTELYERGLALLQQGHPREAIACLAKLVVQEPQRSAAYCLMGDAFSDLGQLDSAVACYRRSIEIEPRFAPAHYNLGAALKDQGQFTDALACFRRALDLQPAFVEAWFNAGYALRKLLRLDEARACFERALELRPDWAEANVNLGDVFHEQGKFREAARCYEQALRTRPDLADAHNNLGNTYFEQGRLDEAAASFRQALAIRTDHADAHYNQSRLMLLRGDFEHGWDEYEWRWRSGPRRVRHSQHPRWNGEDLHGKTILLHSEQGLGDTLQFIRYASQIKNLGATTIVECQKALLPLLKSCAGIDLLFAQGDELPLFEVQVPLLSLPRILKTLVTTIPRQTPYLLASQDLVSHWQTRLSDRSGFRIGVNWHGRVGTLDSHKRDVPVAHFGPLAGIPGVRLLSLQKTRKESASPQDIPASITHLGDEVDERHGPFMDTAAIMMNLDLVITSDTSIAHLAGALGVPVWVALPFVPEWRWLLDRSDSPWYPTMRLFRQAAPGDWTSVFNAMSQEMRVLAT